MMLRAAAPTAVRRPGRDAMLILFAVAVAAATLLAVARSSDSRSSELTVQAHDVAASLRCPVCQDLSAADSPAPMAAQMRQQILQGLRSGRSPEQIRATFVSAYGPSVLVTPPREGVGWVAYVLPLLVLVTAFATGAALLRRLLRRTQPATTADSPEEVPT